MGYPLRHDLPNSRLPDAVIDGKPYPVKGCSSSRQIR
jgi:hypothetical protein